MSLTEEARRELTDSRSPYSAEDKVTVAMAYIVSGGNSVQAVKLLHDAELEGIKPNTIRQWKTRTAWWTTAETVARALLQQDLDRAYTRILHLTEKEMEDRIINGDVVMTKEGPQRLPLKMKDLTYSHAIISDKRAMLRGEATSRSDRNDPIETMRKLAELLRDIGQERRENVIEAEWERIPHVTESE